MKYALTTTPSLTAQDCLVIGLTQKHEKTTWLESLDKTTNGLISRLFDTLTEEADMAWQTDVNGHRLLLVHCGDSTTYSTAGFANLMTLIAAELLEKRISSASICMPAVPKQTANWQVQHMVLAVENLRYQCTAYKSKSPKQHPLKSVTFYALDADASAITTAEGIAKGVQFTKDLANAPANVCTPTYLVEQAHDLAKSLPIKVKHIDKQAMEKYGMGGILGVSKGSSQPPALIELSYQGAGDDKPLVFVGKGITFDTGGISLKPPANMHHMKYDMSGAASVFGTLKACALLKLPVNVIGLVACAENMPSGSALKPGDIITSMAGITIEITNTDAEGRLVLCDALAYAAQHKPKFVVDIATLTGAIVVTLGQHRIGLMSTNKPLTKAIENAAATSQDLVWELPLDKPYHDLMESNIADLVNANLNRSAGSITAGCFLSNFTKDYPWAHLDIAGTAYQTDPELTATGRPVRLLMQLIQDTIDAR